MPGPKKQTIETKELEEDPKIQIVTQDILTNEMLRQVLVNQGKMIESIESLIKLAGEP